ncbi:MAG: SOS response-associated peptidase family protein [Ideonella sp.]|nr:SOS response-associated peptidase family protein [Ideonella sp.]
MCNRYVSPAAGDIERYWTVGARTPWRMAEVFPRAPGPFVRAARDASEAQRELVIGQWGLVPWFAKTAKLPYSTNNARYEEIATKASFKASWHHGKRCIIPALSFDEPNWESGRNVWWRFARADGAPWGLAGLWNTWTDKASGEIVESYTMLTLNADAHPLFRRMHKPDPKLAPDAQDKRGVVAIEFDDVDAWLFGTPEQAASLVRLTPAQAFDAGPLR